MKEIKVKVLEEDTLSKLAVELILEAGNQGYKQVVHYQDSFIVISDTILPKHIREIIFNDKIASVIADYVFHGDCSFIDSDGTFVCGGYKIVLEENRYE